MLLQPRRAALVISYRNLDQRRMDLNKHMQVANRTAQFVCSPPAGYFVYASTYTPSPRRQGRQRPDAEMSRRKKSAKQTSCTIRLYTAYFFNQRCVLRKFRSPPAGSSVDATTYTHWPKHQRPRRPDARIRPRTQSAKQTPPEGDAGEAGV